jgi:hypothetical protein
MLAKIPAKYPQADVARAALARIRELMPGARELAFEKKYATVIAFSPNGRTSDSVFSVVLYRRYVQLYFLNGAVLPDPENKLKGAGKVGRHINLESAATLDDPAVRELMVDAIELTAIPD